MKSHTSLSELSLAVLRSVSDGLEVMHALHGRHRGTMLTEGLAGVRRAQSLGEERARRRRLALLKHRGYLREARLRGRLSYCLSELGEAALLKQELRSAPRLPGKRKTAVIFDIPEILRGRRGSFRRFLKASGFLRLQQSVWISSRDSAKPLSRWIRDKKLRKWVRIWMIEEA